MRQGNIDGSLHHVRIRSLDRRPADADDLGTESDIFTVHTLACQLLHGCRIEQIVMADERGNEGSPRLCIQIRRACGLLDLSLVHQMDHIRHDHRFFLIMRDEDRGDAEIPLDPADLDLQGMPQKCVDRGKRLVKQKHLRLRDDRAGQRSALLLSAGELGRILVQLIAEADDLQHVP